MPDHLDFDAARRALEEIDPTDTWDEATLRAATGSLVQLDAEDATVSLTRRRPRRPRPPTVRLLAIAACFLAVVALAAVVAAERQSVETVPAQTTDCPSTTRPRAITQGAQMKNRFAAPVASAATAILLLGACGDDDSSATTVAPAEEPTSLAQGEGVQFEGTTGLAGETLDINAQETDGQVTGEAQFTPNGLTVDLQCAAERVPAEQGLGSTLILGGEVTATSSDDHPPVGDFMAVIVFEGPRDSVVVWHDFATSGSCEEVLAGVPDDIADDPNVTKVAAGDDNMIQTGWDCAEECG